MPTCVLSSHPLFTPSIHLASLSIFCRYLSGSRVCRTHIYVPGSYPYDLIGPATIFWRPQIPKPVDTIQNEDGGKESEKRTVWIQIHPSVYDECYAALRASASVVLQQALSSGLEEENIEIADLRGQLNIFEITGPKSSQVLKGALTLASTEGAEARDVRLIPSPRPIFTAPHLLSVQFWSSLSQVQTTGSLPTGMIVGLCVNDPRLKFVLICKLWALGEHPLTIKLYRFPPHNAKSVPGQPLEVNPTGELAGCSIWDQPLRKAPRFKKAELDERRYKVFPKERLDLIILSHHLLL